MSYSGTWRNSSIHYNENCIHELYLLIGVGLAPFGDVESFACGARKFMPTLVDCSGIPV